MQQPAGVSLRASLVLPQGSIIQQNSDIHAYAMLWQCFGLPSQLPGALFAQRTFFLSLGGSFRARMTRAAAEGTTEILA